ncbi:unnamed protein product [Adineta steineri]|uniref:RHD domain-containing protein n=1 Tax=Adineta steineri TaxID=433720 RepID=A0A814R715_9BILA|nr:unnamed protein product [Adineta steineri]CAF1129791.1 unnamed protein product [Adineta steineri]
MNLDNAFSSNGIFQLISNNIILNSVFFTILLADVIHGETSSKHEALEIIAQPCPKSKLRYRSDYNSNEKRRGVLQSQNNPNYRSPAIRIPKTYLDVTEHYVIRICLVTVEYEKTKLRYIHPYDLEDIENDTYNDRPNKAIWYPIQGNDIDGIKSFPNLRIVKKKADDLKKHGDFRVFDSHIAGDCTPQLTCMRDTIKEFNLDKAQLAFTVGKKVIDTTNTTIVYALTTIFSNEIIDTTSKELDFDNTPTESKTLRSHPPKLSECFMYKYAPRQGHRNSKDEVLIFYTNGLQLKTYGELEVIFECEIFDGKWWSQPVLDLEVKNQMVSFRTPIFPYTINDITPVNIILRQKKRTLEQLIFNYIPSSQCPNCSQRTMEQMNLCEETSLNKRRRCDVNINDETTDDMTLIFDNNSVIHQSNLEPALSPFSMTENLGEQGFLL